MIKKICIGAFLLCSCLPGPSAQAQGNLYPNTFNLGDVKLLDGPFKKAMELNIKTLLQYNVDRFLAPYLKVAGLPPKAKNYSNWESDGLDGHMGGHYLSAMAIHYAATGNGECKKRMEYMISELKACQEANAAKHPGWGAGYVGGIPASEELWTKVKAGDVGPVQRFWAPWYNLHKMFAGLRDAWLYGGNGDAKSIFIKYCDWAIDITSGLSDARMEEMLGNEHGGMNEVLADAFQITGDAKYLTAAKRFSHKILLDPLSAGIDDLDNKHANTQIPKAIGFVRIGELSQDNKYAGAGSFFWETVTAHRTLAFGGNSRREHFPGAASCTDFINEVEGPESCNTYNMLKLTEDLFRVHPSAKYTDFYERALFNHILSTQHPENGGYVYFTPARPRHYRVYSAPNKAMWCCVGTGMENHGKYSQFIYSHKDDSLFLNLFIASSLNWKDKDITIRQETQFPYEEQTTLKITGGSSRFKLMVRYPAWVRVGALKIKVNGKVLSYNNAHPSSYIAIDRTWKKGDVVQIALPMHNSIEKLPNVSNYIALLHGPILLGARTGTEDLTGLIAGDTRWGHIAGGKKLPVDKAPVFIEDNIAGITEKIVPVKGKPFSFTLSGVKTLNPVDIQLEPFYKIHDARYMIYWMALTSTQYRSYLDSIARAEKESLELQARTIDFVAPGEQQPEADHAIQMENSNTGNAQNEFWRDAAKEGYFSYNLATKAEVGLQLIVRYWGAEWGNRKFDIYIDNEKLLTEDNTGRWNLSAFKDISYAIPDAMVKGKDHIRIKFKALAGNVAGAVYYIRLVKAM
jgi:DUF1680 family protein